MLPGKKYSPEDYLRMAWRRRWWILVPALVVSLGTAVVVFFLPNIYQAETTILIVPQAVPQDFVRSTVTGRLDERLNMISQQMLSRTRLERIIQEVNLYERERKSMIMEDVINRMRGDIKVELITGKRGEDTDAFIVKFKANQARTAMVVTERIASMFVKENLSDRTNAADATSQFLSTELETSKKQLMEHEARLADFRRRNAGQLPTQVDSNLQMMSSTQLQLQNSVEALNRARERQMQVDRDISAILMAVATPVGSTPSPTPAPTDPANPAARGGTTAEQLEAGRAYLVQLQKRYTDANPQVRAVKQRITELEDKLKEESKNAPAGAPVQARLSAGGQEQLLKLRTEMQDLDLRIEGYKRDEARLQGQLATYRSRLEATPALESELAELMRDYGTLQTSYQLRLAKSEEAKSAVNLERRQIGEQFRILDGARLPEKPISPDRVKLNAMGLLIGLGLGFAVAAFLEYRDTSIKTDTDVTISVALPVLAVIPFIHTQADRLRDRRRRRMALGLAAGSLLLITVTAIAMWQLGILERLVT